MLSAMHDWTKECCVSIGTELLQEAGEVKKVKLFINFTFSRKGVEGG